jgi:hypothetical protein
MSAMMKEYGGKKGEDVFYATMNKRDKKDKWEGPKKRGKRNKSFTKGVGK